MDRAIPAGNRLLARRWQVYEQAKHMSRVRSVRPAINVCEDSFLYPKALPHSQPRSLNRDSRRKRLVEITFENYALLDRLRGQTSYYSVKELKKSRRRNERILERMCEFPYRLGRERRAELGPRRRSVLVHRGSALIGGRSYVLEIRKRAQLLTITALHANHAESYSLCVSEDEAAGLTEAGYSRLADYLRVENGELVLKDSPRRKATRRMKVDRSLPDLPSPAEPRYSRKAVGSEAQTRPHFSPPPDPSPVIPLAL